MVGRSLIEIQEWFQRYTVHLMKVCPPEQGVDLSTRVWTSWGGLESVEPLYRFYPTSPEQAADDVFGCELRRGSAAEE